MTKQRGDVYAERNPRMRNDTMAHSAHRAYLWTTLIFWLLAVAAAPTINPYQAISSFDSQRTILIILLCLGAAGAVLAARPPTSKVLSGSLLVFLTIGIFSAVLAPVRLYALAEVSTYALAFLSIYALAALLSSRPSYHLLVASAIGSSVVLYGIVCIFILFAGWAHEGASSLRWPEPVHNFTNVRFLNQWQTWVLPFLPVLLVSRVPQCRPLLSAVFFFAFFALSWGLLIHTGGRGSVYAAIGAIILVVILFGQHGIRWAGIQIAAGLAGLVLAILILGADAPWASSETRQGQLLSFESNGRVALLRMSADLLRTDWMLGIGPMQFAATQQSIAAHPHNFPARMAVEWGLPATVILFSVVAVLSWRWLVFARDHVRVPSTSIWDRQFTIGISASIMAAGAHSLVSGIEVMPMSQIMLVLLVGTAVGYYRYHKQPRAPWRHRYSMAERAAWLAVATLGALILVNVSYLHITRYEAWETQGLAATWGGHQPRFWKQGKLLQLVGSSPRTYWRDGSPADPE